VPLNQWTLVTATGTSGSSSKVYFNGVLQPSSSGNYPSAWTAQCPTAGRVCAGQEVNENRPFIGLINDVAVYNAALTQAQILAIYNAGRGASASRREHEKGSEAGIEPSVSALLFGANG